MIRVRFIINPISGIGRQKTMPDLVDQVIDKTVCEVDMVYTEGPRHATKLARQAAEENIDVVAVVGGDGSVNEVGAGLLHSNTAMAIIPTGSGNGLARHLNIPLALKEAVALINHHPVSYTHLTLPTIA